MRKHHKQIILLNDDSFYNNNIFYRLFSIDNHDAIWEHCINKKNIENCDVIIIKTKYLFEKYTNYKIISYNREENKYLFDFFHITINPINKKILRKILRKIKRYSKTFYILTYKQYK